MASYLGSMGYESNKAMSQDEAKRLRSGFWHKIESQLTRETFWECDLTEMMRQIQIQLHPDRHNRNFTIAFNKDQLGTLDRCFGKGTGRAFSTRPNKGETRVRMQFEEDMDWRKMYGDSGVASRGEKMTYKNCTFGNTTSGTLTSATSGKIASTLASTIADDVRDAMRYSFETMGTAVARKDVIDWATKYDNKNTGRKSLITVRNTPFACRKGTLLSTLQRDFDYWAADYLSVVRQVVAR